MSIWAIGDLQGCYDVTQRLLEKIRFDPAVDRLWFCGDLVNRGGQSLETLRLVHSLREQSVVVLGNHDLSLLAIGARSEEEQRKVNPDLQRVVLADDRDELLDWLTGRPEVSLHLLRALAQRLRRANDVMADLVFTDVPGRVAKALLDLADRFGEQTAEGLEVHHDLTQEELAQLVGASRETANKALADFAARGWLTLSAKSVLIIDADRLAKRAH